MEICRISKLLLLILLTVVSCEKEKTEIAVEKSDPHSYAHPNNVIVTHLDWKATIDFEKKIITATASWKIQNNTNADSLLLDTKNITIERVTLDDNQETKFTLSEVDPVLGERLSIQLKPGIKAVTIHYHTAPEAEALQWLAPEQTAGKASPFLFTQSQAILARSWIPCQDSPGIRFTYTADVSVPKNLIALMSASNSLHKKDSGVYHFEMKQPISSYLLALAVGDVEFKPVSERSGIYAEPALLDAAAWEFADLEKMIEGAEALYGPYLWERYDVIVLPPSFPFGGMENPRLTFATPTILAGDRSLTSLIAHELAHSWSGNLVTNATWNDFWLNEGFTVYFETRIMEKLYGKDYAEMLASLNLQDLKDEIHSLMEKGKQEDTKLKLDLSDRNPDDGVTNIAYNKGYFFLRSIEEEHGREKFDQFLKTYFAENAFKAMDTESFIRYIKDYYQKQFNTELVNDHFNSWIYTTGLPTDCPQPVSTKFTKVDEVTDRWKSENILDKKNAESWSTHEWLHFLKNLPEKLSVEEMTTLDNFGGFTNSGNSEIITAWGVIAIRNSFPKAYPKIESFLMQTGRRKFLMPLYQEMLKTEAGKQRAKDIYRRARQNYHFVATNSLDKLINT